jgi:tetratricopeptide (TPR) repeat protein
LVRQEKLPDAQAEVEQAIALTPDWAYAHYCRSVVLEERRQFADAELSAREAVRLDPADADNYARVSAVLYRQGKWQNAHDAALEGLAHDAEHAACGNLRTMALTKLGRQNDALASVDQSLAGRPDDAMAHANKGWALLHQGQPKPALVHFREALRLDPTSDYARQGTVEALKARNPIYRLMLGYFLWMARLSDKARWGVILVGWFGAKILRDAARREPALEPYVTPILVVYTVFVLLTWFSIPLFNLLLRMSRFGRHALSRDQRASSNWFAACLAAFAGCVAWSFTTDSDTPIYAGISVLGIALPLTMIYHCDPGWPRQMMTLFTVALALVGAAAATGSALGATWVGPAWGVFVVGAILSPWMVNYLMSVTARR